MYGVSGLKIYYEDEEDDMEIVSFTDRDILNKVNKNGYYTLNESVEELKN